MTMTDTSKQHPPRYAPTVRELVALAWPMALSMLSYSLMTAVDTLFVGRFGAEAIAAVGLGGLLSFTLLTFGTGLLRGGKIFAAHAMGAHRVAEVPRLASATIVISLFSTVGTWALTLAVVPLLGQVFREQRANELIASYVVIRSCALPALFVATALRELSQGVGDSRGPMWAAVSANLVNIPLNALFVLGFGWGVSGSAWANVLAQFVDLAWLAWQRRSWLLELARVRWSLVSRIAIKSWPLGAEMFLDVSAFSALGFVVARLGANEMAAHQIGLQICHLSILPILALGDAASVLAGRAAGGRQLALVPVIYRVGILVGLGLSSLTGIPLLAFPEFAASVFTPDRAVRTLTGILMPAVVGFQVAFSLYCLGKSVLRGLGDIRFAATITVAAAWICSPPLAFVFGHLLGWGVVGAWCALGVEITLASMIYLWRFERRGWLHQVGRFELHAPVPNSHPGLEDARTRLDGIASSASV